MKLRSSDIGRKYTAPRCPRVMTRAATAQTIKSAAKPPVRISRFSAPSQNHLPEWVSVCKACHTEEAIARKAAISIPLARFSGIGIAMQDPIWYAGQEENWKNRGLGKEWAA